jgi:hypothetical protein
MGAKADPDVDVPTVPFVNENKAVTRLPLVIESERAQSGNLPIQPVDNPVIDDKPFKNLRSK